MDMNKIKLIFSEKYNQFYKPIRIDEDVGIVYMQITKNRHDKSIKKNEIAHIEKNRRYKYVVMHDDNVTAEDFFIRTMNGKCYLHDKISELHNFEKNLLVDSECAMKTLQELAEKKVFRGSGQKRPDKTTDIVCNMAWRLFQDINHIKILIDNQDTYNGQDIPSDIKNLALSKRLFIERRDEYVGKPKHPATYKEKASTQRRLPCGFMIKDKGGNVVAGQKYKLSAQEVVDFVKSYTFDPDKHYKRTYYVPMSSQHRKQLAMCYKILKERGLHYKNEHNCFFWVLDKKGNVVAGDKNGFGFKGLLRFCRKLKYGEIQVNNQ